MEKILVTPREAMQKLNLSQATFYRLARRGMPKIKISHKVVRYDLEEVLTWLKTNR